MSKPQKQIELESSVKLLWNCANALSSETHTERLLKSYYLNTSRKIAKFKTQLPNEQYGAARMCPRCATQWHESAAFHLQLKPQRVANNSKARRLIAKLDDFKNKQLQGTLTKSQRKRAKWLQKRVVSNIQINCEFCQHKTLLPLEKPKKRLKDVTTRDEDIEPTILPDNKQVKNKSLAPINPATAINSVKLIKSQKPLIISTTKTSTKSTTKNMSVPNATTQRSNKKNNKKPNKSSKQKSSAVVQSKTQQQNSLMQLAALLKTQASKNASNTPQNRLDSLLQ